LQEYGADFSAFVGKIYGDWQEEVHVRRHTFNPDWPNYMAFDWGFTNPLAAVEFQVDPWGRVRVWREHYKAFWRLEEHIAYLKQRPNPAGYRLDLCFGDAADPGAASYVTEHFAPCIADPRAKSGSVDEKGKKAFESGWREGVELVGSYLKVADRLEWATDFSELVTPADLELRTETAEPLLTVDPSCENGIREFNNYKAPETRGEVNVREAAQKYEDHFLDALRYGMMHLFKLGARTRLSDVYKSQDLNQSAPSTGYFTTGNMDF
jgi:hypothetical protein